MRSSSSAIGREQFDEWTGLDLSTGLFDSCSRGETTTRVVGQFGAQEAGTVRPWFFRTGQ